MIKALLLIFFPVPTWERIATAQRRVIPILLTHLLPLLLLGSLAEGYGMVHWGKPRGEIPYIKTIPLPQTVVYQIVQIVVLIGIVFVVAWLVKSLGETFHGRHIFRQAFTVAAYGLSPVFLMRIADMSPGISPWVTWAIGVCLAATILYKGLPRVMQPDPPHAFGLYLMSVLLLTFVTGLARFVTAWYLKGKFPALDALISKIATHLPF
jgi:Yip1 domain